MQRTGVTRGTVSVAIPAGDGRRYALRLLRGGKPLRQMTIRTPPATAPAPAPPVTPPMGKPVCPPGVPAGQIELGAPSVVRGEQLPFSILNTGPTCFAPASVVGLERQDGEDWTSVPMLPIAFAAVYYVVPPGQRDRSAVGTLADAQPGTYRVTVRLSSANLMGPPIESSSTLIQASFAVTDPLAAP